MKIDFLGAPSDFLGPSLCFPMLPSQIKIKPNPAKSNKNQSKIKSKSSQIKIKIKILGNHVKNISNHRKSLEILIEILYKS